MDFLDDSDYEEEKDGSVKDDVVSGGQYFLPIH